MLTLVFDDKDAAVGQQAKEVRVEAVLRGLQAEGRRLAGEVANPVFHFGQPIDKLGTFKFFRK